MKRSEKLLVGAALVAAGIGGIGFMLVLPAWTSMGEAQAKIATLQSQISDTDSKKAMAQTELDRLSKPLSIPANLTIRTYADNTLEQNLKEMLDQVIRLGSRTGNILISLEPMADPGIAPPPPPPKTGSGGLNITTAPAAGTPSGAQPAPPAGGSPATTATATAGTNPNDPNAKPTPPDPASQLIARSYNLSFRGSYPNLLAFLSSLNQHNELLQIRNVNIQNEGGAQRSSANTVASNSSGGSNIPAGSGKLNPSKPIKLTLQVRLVLQPATAVAGSPETTTPASANPIVQPKG